MQTSPWLKYLVWFYFNPPVRELLESHTKPSLGMSYPPFTSLVYFTINPSLLKCIYSTNTSLVLTKEECFWNIRRLWDVGGLIPNRWHWEVIEQRPREWQDGWQPCLSICITPWVWLLPCTSEIDSDSWKTFLGINKDKGKKIAGKQFI